MSNALSLYLDFIRFSAALAVFYSHLYYDRIGSGIVVYIFTGHDAVVVFFVLSGFVIAYATKRKPLGIRVYFVDRLSRLMSVTVAALVLSFVISIIGPEINSRIFDPKWNNIDNIFQTFFLSITFFNEVWFISERAFVNGPYWSISYEFMYYLFYVPIYFMRGWQRISVASLILLMMGPKIALLLPLWLLGVITFKYLDKIILPLSVSFILIVMTLVLYVVYLKLGWRTMVSDFGKELLFDLFQIKVHRSGSYLSDYILGIFIAATFFAANSISVRIPTILDFASQAIRYAASFTFSLYLFHYPLLHLYAAIFDDIPHEVGRLMIIVVLTLLSVWGLGLVTEHRKNEWRRGVDRLLRWPLSVRWCKGGA